MKLIVGISKELFEEIKCDEACGLNELTRVIANGTPLEDIKTEIEQLKPNNPNFKHYVGETRAINNVLDILDKHIKEN